MKNLIFALILSTSAWSQEIPQTTLERLQKLYPDQSQDFIKERIKNAPTPFNKWRSFPPYYYELIKRSGVLKDRKGLCAGDAHLENFGFIAGSENPIFTLNDLDDVTECSLDADLMRLFIGQRLINPELKSDVFLAHYQTGLKGGTCPQPDFIKKLQKDAVKKGKGLSKKNKALLESKTCTGEYAPLSDDEKKMIEDFVKAENGDQTCLKSEVLSEELRALAKSVTNQDPKEILHACTRIKESGGSAGGKRFVVFRKSASGVTDAFELKPLVKSAPDYDLVVTNELRQKKYESAVKVYLGDSLKEHYYPVTLNKVLYQRRPLWGGNEEVKEEDIDKADMAQKEAVMLFETCTLGNLHARSSRAKLKSRSMKGWDELAKSIEKQFKSEFGHK